MFLIALRILLHKPMRTTATLLGVAVAFFLSAAQTGLLLGWCDTISALTRNAGVDLWVMAPRTPSYDYGTAISSNNIYRARSVPGVVWAEGLYVDWTYWQCPDGKRINVQLIGLDRSLVGGPWAMAYGKIEAVHAPETVVADELYLPALGVSKVGDEVELLGQRARLGAISTEIRTFTAAPFVFTSLKSAIRYDRRYRDDEVTYVLVQCDPKASVLDVRAGVAAEMPELEVLTTEEFSLRSIRYWMIQTGLGLTVMVTAFLGLCVGVVVTSQTLFAMTHDHLGDFAMLGALGFSRLKLVGIVVVQACMLVTVGVALGDTAFRYAAHVSVGTPVPLEMPWKIGALLAGIFLVSSFGVSVLSIREILRVDPISVFRS